MAKAGKRIRGSARDRRDGAGAVVKTIGDAVMATFPRPDRAVAAALRMREAMLRLNAHASPSERPVVTTEAVVEDALISLILHDSGIISASRMAELQGIGSEFRIFTLS